MPESPSPVEKAIVFDVDDDFSWRGRRPLRPEEESGEISPANSYQGIIERCLNAGYVPACPIRLLFRLLMITETDSTNTTQSQQKEQPTPDGSDDDHLA